MYIRGRFWRPLTKALGKQTRVCSNTGRKLPYWGCLPMRQKKREQTGMWTRGPVTSAANGAAGALVSAIITSAAVRHTRDDISSQASHSGLTSPQALIPVALIRMYCELILCYCYSPLLVISVTSLPPLLSYPSSLLCARCSYILRRQTDRNRKRERERRIR